MDIQRRVIILKCIMEILKQTGDIAICMQNTLLFISTLRKKKKLAVGLTTSVIARK